MRNKDERQEGPYVELGREDPRREDYRYWTMVWQRFRRHRMAMLGSIILVILVLGALMGPIVSPYDVYELNLDQMLHAPSLFHPAGTDDMGRDELTRALAAGRISLTLGLVAASVSIFIGSVLGIIAGFYGGQWDALIMRFTDMMISFPPLLLLILFASILGKNLATIAVVVGSLGWMQVARLVRASCLSLKEQDFVRAAYSIGASDARLMLRHILPNVMGPIIVAGTLGVGQGIMMESALSYLGLGVQPPIASWGAMLRLAQDQLVSAPWLSALPGLMIVLSVLSINFLGDGLRDALDPHHLLT